MNSNVKTQEPLQKAACVLLLFRFQHPVANTDMGLDVLSVRILFDFLAQGCHMHPLRCHMALPGAAPDLIGQIGVGQHFACVLCKQAQKLVLCGRQLQLLTV